ATYAIQSLRPLNPPVSRVDRVSFQRKKSNAGKGGQYFGIRLAGVWPRTSSAGQQGAFSSPQGVCCGTPLPAGNLAQKSFAEFRGVPATCPFGSKRADRPVIQKADVGPTAKHRLFSCKNR